MEKVSIELIRRFLSSADSEEALRIWTIIQVLSDTKDTLAWRGCHYHNRFRENEFDSDLLECILNTASTDELVAVLSSPILKGMSVEMYRKFFDKICSREVDDEKLYYVGFSADMFLDIHPGAFVFPRQLLDRLLTADDELKKGVGTQLLTHSDVDPQERIDIILSAIELGAKPGWRRFDLVCLTAFREFAREYDLNAFGEGYVKRAREVLGACLARQSEEDKAMVRQSLAYIPRLTVEGGPDGKVNGRL